jgi:hypothetical protein
MMATFRIDLYPIIDGEETMVCCTVDYDAHHQAAKVSGPPEDCYPEDGDLCINSIEPDTPDFPAEMVEAIEAAKDRIEETAWEDYHSRGIDDDGPEPYPEDRD